MTEEEKQRLVGNIVGALGKVTRRDIQLRDISNFYRADADYGTRIAKGLVWISTLRWLLAELAVQPEPPLR